MAVSFLCSATRADKERSFDAWRTLDERCSHLVQHPQAFGQDGIVLDFDATDDPLHGSQEGGYFNGYYRHCCYLPLYCFCGNIPFLAKLRDCKRDASDGTVEALQKIVPAIRNRFGRKVKIILRTDSGFAREAIMSWSEEHGVWYCFDLARNDRLSRLFSSPVAFCSSCSVSNITRSGYCAAKA